MPVVVEMSFDLIFINHSSGMGILFGFQFEFMSFTAALPVFNAIPYPTGKHPFETSLHEPCG